MSVQETAGLFEYDVFVVVVVKFPSGPVKRAGLIIIKAIDRPLPKTSSKTVLGVVQD